MTRTKKNVTLKSVSESCQYLILTMRKLGHGTITSLMIVHGEPVMEHAQVCARRRFSKQQEPKPVSPNFRLKDSHMFMLEVFDEIYDGTINCIKFADGLPIEIDHYLSN